VSCGCGARSATTGGVQRRCPPAWLGPPHSNPARLPTIGQGHRAAKRESVARLIVREPRSNKGTFDQRRRDHLRPRPGCRGRVPHGTFVSPVHAQCSTIKNDLIMRTSAAPVTFVNGTRLTIASAAQG
jgi:hypothetical protein